MTIIEVFADVACPFAHASLRRFEAYRTERGSTGPLLRVRAWPLEIVNGKPHQGATLAPEIQAMRDGVAPDLFLGFDETAFPATTLPALAAAAAAYRQDAHLGERFSFALRTALFEEGLDVSDGDVLQGLRETHGVPDPTEADRAQVRVDNEEGKGRGVQGSPHFFTESGDFFCPSLDIHHDHGAFQVAFDVEGFRRFMSAVFS